MSESEAVQMVVVCGSGDGVLVVGVRMRKCGAVVVTTLKKSVSSGSIGRPGWVGRPIVGRPGWVGHPVSGRIAGTG